MKFRSSLTAKLFVAIAAAVLLVVLVVVAAVALNMRAGFTSYLLNAELGRLGALDTALENSPSAVQGWPELRDRTTWNALLREMERGPGGRTERPPLSGGPRPPQGPGADDGGPPRRDHDPLDITDRLVLETVQGQVLAGPSDRIGTSTVRDLTSDNGAMLGRLRLYEPRGVGAPVNQIFRAAQVRTLGYILFIAVVLSALVSWLLARHFAKPIRAVGNSMNRLATGNFKARLPTVRKDEIGRLMRDHNALAESLTNARMREQAWITDASHELKTPLAILRAEIEALQDGVRQPTESTLARLHATVMRLSRLVSDLNMSMQDERPVTSGETLDLARLVSRAVVDASPRIESSGLAITVEAADSVAVHGDPDRLRQVIDNLLENACRYTTTPGRIRITCEADGAMAVLTVEDTPPVPADEALPRLFDRFFRGEASRSRSLGGSGLGLAICRSIVESHGGTIRADRSYLGGLRVMVGLPLAGARAND
ncbi:ATP-binding protein [Rhizobiaceae bacterium]|nr:ATP-binding protein [Rhizobiaceae bacterium]